MTGHPTSSARRVVAFVAVCVLAVTGAVAVALFDLGRRTARTAASTPVAETTPEAFAGESRLVFRNTALGPDYGRVAMVALDDPGGPRAIGSLTCERIDMTGTTGSCLLARRGVVTRYEWLDVNAQLEVTHRRPLTGIPSRTRVSPDGRLTASTVFVSGHSYLQTGFSTATEVREVGGGAGWGNLERFTLYVDGAAMDAADRNVWGVSFVDDRTFYATVATGGTTYLVQGDLDQRTLTSVRRHAECPAVSPDGRRVAYKVDVADGREVRWVAAVLDLESGEQRVLERGGPGFDDQLQWLDDDTLMYGLARADEPGVTDVWALDVDTEAPAEVLVEQAWSPAVVP